MSSRLRNFVGGTHVESADIDYDDIVDPSTGTTYLSAPSSGAVEVDLAMQAAADAFEEWHCTTPAKRQRVLLRIADDLDTRAAELMSAELRNTGNRAAGAELPVMADQLRFFAGAARLLVGRSAGED